LKKKLIEDGKMNLIDCDVKDRDSFKDIYEFDFAFNVAYN